VAQMGYELRIFVRSGAPVLRQYQIASPGG
jgi:hypothetical protein